MSLANAIGEAIWQEFNGLPNRSVKVEYEKRANAYFCSVRSSQAPTSATASCRVTAMSFQIDQAAAITLTLRELQQEMTKQMAKGFPSLHS